MRTVTGVFTSQSDAERAVRRLRSEIVPSGKITLLTPGNTGKELEKLPVVTAEQPGMGKAIGALVGAAAGMSGEGLLFAIIPGIGPVTALGIYGAAILAAAGAGIGAAAGGRLENSMTEGIPEDEIFVYEDALRKGRSVVVALAPDEKEASQIRETLHAEGAESVDAAREEWWIGLRSAEQEHYLQYGGDFSNDEKYYRRGFEAALHARHRCQEFDQISAEMDRAVEDLQRQHPEANVAEPFSRGYQRGREYYARFCRDQSKAA